MLSPVSMEFPNTNWTILASATLNGDTSGHEALNELCRSYWQPIAAFIRSRGFPSERVEDLTQDFFIQIMERQFFKRADRDKGRFRSFMLGSLRLFLTDALRHQNAQKRGGHLEQTVLGENDITMEMEELQFDQSWAEMVFERSLKKLEDIVLKKRTPQGWTLLRCFLPGPSTMRSVSYLELGEEIGLTEGGAKTEVFRLRQQFRDALRAEVALTVGAPHEVDEELSHLRSTLERSTLL